MTISIVQVATAGTSASGASATATFGSTPTQGNLLLAIGTRGANTAFDVGEVGDVTWTPLANNIYTNGALSVYWKYAGASESTTVTFSGSSGNIRSTGAIELSSSVGFVIPGRCSGNNDGTTPATTHDWESTPVQPGLAMAIGFLTNSGGATTWNNAWTDSFSRISGAPWDTSRVDVATRTITSAVSTAPTNTSAASRQSCLITLSFWESPRKRPWIKQFNWSRISTGNDPTANFTVAPTDGNLLVMIGDAASNVGTPPSGYVARHTLSATNIRHSMWTKVASSDGTSYTLDTTTSERHSVFNMEIADWQGWDLVSQGDSSNSASSLTSTNLPWADGLAFRIASETTSGGAANWQDTWNNGFTKAGRIFSTADPAVTFAIRYLEGPVQNLTTTETLSAAKAYAGTIFSFQAPRHWWIQQGQVPLMAAVR